MKIITIISKLLDAGIYIFVENGKLKTRADESALTPEIVSLIKNNKEALIDYFSTIYQVGHISQKTITPQNKQSALLSFAQQRLWLLDQIDGSSAHYNIPSVLKLSGRLDYDAVNQTFSSIVARHESLRTCFSMDEDGQPQQIIQAAVPVVVPIVDLSTSPAGERELQLSQRIAAEAAKVFDLGADLMLRAQLLKVTADEYIVLVTMHHIAADGWSMSILVNEFSALYSAYSQGNVNPLEPLAIQYADYAAWQRDWLQGEVLDQQLSYWTSRLANLPVVHSLPLDHARPPVQTFAGDNFTTRIDVATTKLLLNLCQAHGATLFMGLHAAFSVLLARYSNETDIVVGSPIANREQAEVAPLIGFFVNTLVLRSDLSGNPSFNDLLKQSKSMLLDAYAHQQVPFEQIVEHLQPERSLSHSALFQIMLVLQNNQQSELQLPDLTLTPLMELGAVAKHDLTLMAIEADGGLSLQWEFNTDLFEPDTIARMAGHFELLLRALVTYPDNNVFHLEMLSAQERQQLLNEKLSGIDDAHHHCLHELFEAQVKQNPQQVAVVFEGQSLTYDDLNNKANQLAHYLINERQVKPDTLVGVCVERSLDMVIGILAILKAGGAYVPLDPEYPEARLAYMLGDAQLTTVLTQRHLRATTPMSNLQALCLDDELVQQQLAQQNPNNIQPQSLGLMPHHLAYVIYTSGSTGHPKGVMVEHGDLLFHLQTCSTVYGLGKEARVLQFATINFDAAQEQLFTALISGATLYLRPNVLWSAKEFYEYCTEHEITIANFPPGYCLELLESAALTQQFATSLALKTVIVGGEALTKSVVDNWNQSALKFDLINAYGPTETVITACFHRFEKTYPALPITSIPIGKPFTGRQCYVLNQYNALQPQGVIGELCIGGRGLARGYLNRSDLTAEKFISNGFLSPNNNSSTQRLYKTGDLVRWLPDGNLEFCGRIDDQVKVRGFRIELSEIENTLVQHADVKEAVILAKELAGRSGDKRIVAYVVTDAVDLQDESELAVELRRTFIATLRQHLGQALPDYMIPAAFVLLKQLPATPSGKVDRKALPDPDFTTLQETYSAPGTETEKILCELWQEVLGIERVGMSDNFFQLGGHSLLATRLVARINQTFHVTLPLKSLFAAQTVQELAQALLLLNVDSNRPAMVKVSREQPLLTSYAQQRLWLLDQISGGSAHYNMPSALRLSGNLHKKALDQALTSIVERHESLRTYFVSGDNGHVLQVIQAPVPFVTTFVDLTSLGEDARELQLTQYLADEANRTFDLSSDLMLRAQLIKVADDEHILLVTMHHIASDGWSITLLVNEFRALYGAYVQGQSNPLVPLAIQYADYAHWQRNWLQGEVLDQQLGYWEEKLAGLPLVHSLPLDHARPAQQRFVGGTYASQINTETTRLLHELCKNFGATLFMGLHAAFSVLLSRYSNESDIVVGSPIANREQADVANLIGFFVNTLVLRSDLSASPSFCDLLLQSKYTLLDAYAHQQVPFEQIVERLQPERSLSHSALFQVMLILQNNAEAILSLPDLTLDLVQQKGVVAKYDLTLSVSDTTQGLQLIWEYNTDLFEHASIARMATHFDVLLKSLLAAPHENVFAVDMLSSQERQQLLVEWNSTTIEYPKEKCIHELFEIQVQKNRDAIAVAFDSQQLTYGELNRKANQLANYLIHKKHVQPGNLVGICVERSLDMVIGILAILKAGAAYVPLDPEYPEARLAYMLTDANLTTVLTQHHLLNTTPINHKQALCMDSDEIQTCLNSENAQDNDLPQLGLSSNHLAYVIYTSGSTGNPKGVMVEHGNVVNFLNTICQRPGIAAKDCLLAVTSTSFDIHGLELFLPLIVGAKLVVASRVATGRPDLLLALMAQHRVTLMQATPATWKMLLEANWQQQTPLKVLCGGEALSLNLARGILASQAIELWNMYGPTETTIWSSTKQILLDEPEVLMGGPIGNTQLYVVSKELTPVPIGVAGELLIAGAGVTRGYLHRPDLTAEKFIINPFYSPTNAASSERVYKTGDLVRWLPNGSVEFLGRLDHQVKVRGFRIELGEIESALNALADVKDVVVLARDMLGDDKCLVAYVVTADSVNLQNDSEAALEERSALINSMRQQLSQTLPDYMVPSVFVLLGELPLTPNGKVDRKALPAPDISAGQSTYIAPQTDIEKLLCDIWQEVLGVERVGVTDNFFQLGGHSLLLIKMTSLAAYKGLAISVKQGFFAKNIRELALVCKFQEGGTFSDTLYNIGVIPIAPNLAYSLSVMNDEINRWLFINLLQCSVTLNAELLEKSVELLIKRHDVFRLSHNKGLDGAWFSEILPFDYKIPFQMIDFSGVAEADFNESVKKVCEQLETQSSIVTGPLVQVALLDYGVNQPSRLLVSVHHYAADAFSVDLVLQELLHIYTNLVQGDNYLLPPPPPGYMDYVLAIQKYSQTPACTKQLDYWLAADKLKDHNIPVDFDNKHIDGWRLRNFTTMTPIHNMNRFSLDTDNGDLLQEIILAALLKAYSEWSTKDYLHINLVNGGRNVDAYEMDFSRTVGWISYMNPVVLKLEGHTHALDVVTSVSKQIRSVPQDNSFGILKYCHADPAVRLRMHEVPEPQINFNYFSRHLNSNNNVNAVDEAAHTMRFSSIPLSSGHEPGAEIVVNPGGILMHYMALSCDLIDDNVRMNWMYVVELLAEDSMRKLSQLFDSSLQELAATIFKE